MILKRNNHRGFSLVELLLFMAIAGIFLALATQVLGWAIDFKLESSGSSSVDLSGQYIYHKLSHDLRRASAIVQPTTAGQTGSTLQLTINGQAVTYSWSNERLLMTIGGSTETLSDASVRVTNFSVTRVGVAPQSPSVTINFALQSVDVTSGNISQNRIWQFTHTLR